MRRIAWCVVVVLCGLPCQAGPEATFYFDNGDKTSGEIVGGQGLAFEVRAETFPQPVRVDLAKVRKITFANPAAGADQAAQRVLLPLGTSISGTLEGMDPKRILITTAWAGRLGIDRARAEAILFHPGARPPAAGARDVVTLSNSDRISGEVLRIAGGKLSMKTAFGEIAPGLDVVAAVSFADRDALEPAGAARRCKVRFADGDSLIGQPASVGPQAIVLTTQDVGQVRAKLGTLRRVVFSDGATFLIGHTLIAEYGAGRVVIIDEKGKTIWHKDGLSSPTKAQPLDNDNILLVESGRRMVLEVNSDGNVVWSRKGFHVYDAKRLPNGNTVVCDNSRGRAIMLDPDGHPLWEVNCTSSARDVDALPNGHILVAGSSRVQEFDPKGQVVWQKTDADHARSAERLANGHTLIANSTDVVEVDKDGKVVWQHSGLNKATAAQRLPNGNTLICESGAGRVIEVAPDGRIVWQVVGLSSPTDAVRF